MIPVLPDDPAPKTLCEEARVLVESAEAVLAGKSLRSVALELTARGVPSPRRPNARTLRENPGGVVTYWHPGSLRQRLLNPTIAGRRVHQGQDIGEATWAPVIDHGTWLRLHAALTNPSRLSAPPRGKQPRHLLSGIARCGECGER
ncbi:recombinase family protein [Brachybacterium sp. GCM10030252]|uniref:recombinase family protein n=1 Tax=Brachybacterium sp. GCM10030252 TaxID=3273380 RepID=UPI0036156F6B